MAKFTIQSDKLGVEIANEIKARINSTSLSSVLVDRAKKRIRTGGDSTIKYPELWASKTNIGLRKNGKPLRDTGHLMNMLSSVSEKTPSGAMWKLKDGSGYGVKHQEGFTNKGPIAIALSAKARLIIKAMGEPPHDIAALDSAGLEEAPNEESAQNPRRGNLKYDYYIIEGGAKVPPRPIANMPPEDIKEITKVIKRAIKGIT